MESPRSEHDQVGLLLFNMRDARLHWIAARTDFRDAYRKLFENGRARTVGSKHLPSLKSLSHRRKLSPVIQMPPARVHDDELGFQDQRNGKRMGKR